MKEIRRFQRTMIVTLVGINILVFSSSFYGSISSAFGHAILGMSITLILLLIFSFYQRYKLSKNSNQQVPQSNEI